MPHLYLTILLVLGGSSHAFATAQASRPSQVQSLEFIAYLGEQEISRETVEVRDDGWSSTGSFDVLGTRQGSFAIDVRETPPATLAWKLTSSGQKVEIDFADGKLDVRVPSSGMSKSTAVPPGEAFVYEDLIWGSFVKLGTTLDRSADRDSLEPGVTLQALIGSAAIALPVTLRQHSTSVQRIEGMRRILRVFVIDFAGKVDMTIVCDEAGMPCRIEVPSQRVAVERTGYESVRVAADTPTSIVDSGAWRDQLSQPEHEVRIDRTVKIPMRDGVELMAEVYLPEGDGPFPTILARTPYTRASEGSLKGHHYAKPGYAFVAQDVRGRFDSGGEWFPFVHESRDGSDTLNWIAEQPWSDGKVGMVGASYVGIVQWLVAKTGNPHLTCIVPQVSPPDPQENFPYEGGAFLMGAAWWARVLEAMEDGEDINRGVDWARVYRTLPAGDLDQALGLTEQTFLDTWLAHPPHDLEFWETASYQGSFGRMSVPAFHVTGWWDGDMPGALQNFAGMCRSARTAAARDSQYLVVGPWTHAFNTQRAVGDTDYGDEAVIDLDARILRFFDRYLKGVENGIEAEPKVFTFTMGANRWHADERWPLTNTQFQKLFLSSGGKANSIDGDGRLGLTRPKSGTERDSYRYDPTALPDLDIDFTDLLGTEVTMDKSDDPDRSDDLEYWSPALAQPCEIVGPIEVVLFASTDAADTDFTATIYRVTPAGEHLLIRNGMQRLRYAADPLRDRPVPPGEIRRVTIDCWATGVRLEAGDRFLLRVSSWAWPGFARNLNTLESAATATEGVVAHNTVFHDRLRASHLSLPVVPRDDAPGLTFAPR